MTELTGAHGASWRRRVLWLSFLESFGTILLERAIYFFSHERLAYSERDNLALALSFGVTYTAGATLSHGIARRLGDRLTLATALLALLALHAWLAVLPGGRSLPIAFALIGAFEGAKWPVIESYVGAGLAPGEQLRAVGRFNVSWALAVPLALGVAGPLIVSGVPGALFVLAAAVNVISLLLVAVLPPAAPHLGDTDPARPPVLALARYRELLSSSRWSMLCSYTLTFLLAPLLPEVFRRLSLGVTQATFWAAWMDAVRVLTFAGLAAFPGWHGRRSPLWLAALGLPSGFAAVAFGQSLWVVLMGELLFGVLAGVTYYSALYYALLVKNASVDAGGVHESLIGLGLVLGPGLGLLGHVLANVAGGYSGGLLLATAPLVIVCWFGSMRPLVRVERARAAAG